MASHFKLGKLNEEVVTSGGEQYFRLTQPVEIKGETVEIVAEHPIRASAPATRAGLEARQTALVQLENAIAFIEDNPDARVMRRLPTDEQINDELPPRVALPHEFPDDYPKTLPRE